MVWSTSAIQIISGNKQGNKLVMHTWHDVSATEGCPGGGGDSLLGQSRHPYQHLKYILNSAKPECQKQVMMGEQRNIGASNMKASKRFFCLVHFQIIIKILTFQHLSNEEVEVIKMIKKCGGICVI